MLYIVAASVLPVLAVVFLCCCIGNSKSGGSPLDEMADSIDGSSSSLATPGIDLPPSALEPIVSERELIDPPPG